MKIATKTRYAMRVMIDLAARVDEGCVPLKDVADRQGISKKYLEQVVSPLVSSSFKCHAWTSWGLQTYAHAKRNHLC